jgi:hypothetical protein
MSPLSESEKASRALTDLYKPSRWSWDRRTWSRMTWLLAGGVPVLALTLGTMYAGWWRQRHAPGPVSVAHAGWESSCETCHAPGVPAGSGRVESGRCRSCHAGTEHHDMCQNFEAQCADCHKEHRGRDAPLRRVNDDSCTRCHSNLPAHFNPDEVALHCAPHVRVFGRPPDHPTFPTADPGRLKFNHALHMSAGLVPDRDGKPFGEALTYGQLPAEYRDSHFKKTSAADPVQMECVTCHKRDPADAGPALPATGLGSARAPGTYMLPIAYERDCKACHPLPYDPQNADRKVPHGLQPPEVHRFLELTCLDDYLCEGPAFLNRRLPARPGAPPVAGWPAGSEEAKALKIVRGEVEAAERYLYSGATTCGKCHYYEPSAEGPAPRRIVPTNLPEVWFRHAYFGHTAHRALDCLACHAGAATSTAASDVLVPGMDTCLQCHAQGSGGWAGARNDCALCHVYHHADTPLAGAGVLAGDPPRRPGLGIDAFRQWPQEPPKPAPAP